MNAVPAPVKRNGRAGRHHVQLRGRPGGAGDAHVPAHRARRTVRQCVTQTNGNASKPRCTRTLTDGVVRVQAKRGTNRLRFEGRVTRAKKLKAGTYSVVLTAKRNGAEASTTKTLRFTIARG